MDKNSRYAYEDTEATPYDRGTLAAIFDSPSDAKQALADLQDAGFRKTWMGVTSASSPGTPSGNYNQATGKFTPYTEGSASGEHQVETAGGGGIGQTLSRFFGETSQHSLHEALTKQGVPQSDALALDHRMHDGGAVITVQVQDRYDEALQILRRDRGDVAASGSINVARGSAIVGSAMPTSKVDANVDDETTLTLSEERLSIDKQRVAAGEATIGKKVVTEDATVDVPVMHEELFIERRPVTERASSAPIGANETIRIPLMREQVVVDKRAFVREEVEIGKRAVTGTQRVDDTVRHEELVVDEGIAGSRSTGGDPPLRDRRP